MITKLNDIVYENITYKVINHKRICNYYKTRLSVLKRTEKSTFRKYRCRKMIKNNVNEKLRQHKDCKDATTMSLALKKAKHRIFDCF